MNKKEYKEFVKQSEKGTLQTLDRINHAIFGMAGEIGECIDCIKKVIFHGHKYDSRIFLNELGDFLWYCTLFTICYEEKYEVNLSYFENDLIDMSKHNVKSENYGRSHLFDIFIDVAGITASLKKEEMFTEYILAGLIEEMYYNIEALCYINGINLYDLIYINVKKIRKRYPNGFDPSRSINREKIPTNTVYGLMGVDMGAGDYLYPQIIHPQSTNNQTVISKISKSIEEIYKASGIPEKDMLHYPNSKGSCISCDKYDKEHNECLNIDKNGHVKCWMSLEGGEY